MDSTTTEKYWAFALAHSPEPEREVALALIRSAGTGRAGDILGGLTGLHLGTARTIKEVSLDIAAARADIMKAVEAAAALRNIPANVAAEILAAVMAELPAVTKAVTDGINKEAGTKAIFAAAAAHKDLIGQMAASHKAIADLAPVAQGHALGFAQGAQQIIDSAGKLETQAKSIHGLAEQFFAGYKEASFQIRLREWAIAAALSAALICPLTWMIRGAIRPTPPAPDLVQLVAARGGQFACSTRQDGQVAIAVKGGTPQSSDGWSVFTFAPPPPTH
jgi:hypothetical protein